MVERLDRFVRLLIVAWMLATTLVLSPIAPALAFEISSQELLAGADTRSAGMQLDEDLSADDHNHSDQGADHTHDVPWLVTTSSIDRLAEKSAKWRLVQAKAPHRDAVMFERPPRL
ncbi:hypothetical protein [Rhizobium lusitanum]|uniref:Uncharacterized protein n=1 Tax=Rhizobium lusitanum TaxID=293958 RepID=A0A7X0MEL0_9HYPH|nr:hypothetical protein [Rhizobium lusitanum]MBB6486160.1 hypothetical protein [Rhizobium lusitanum]